MEDLITRRAAISTYKTLCSGIACKGCPFFDSKGMTDCRLLRALHKVQSAQPEIIRCMDCRWWDRYDDNIGYCHAAKHGHWSEHWDIRIWRVYRGDFYCADAELRLEEEGEDETN